MKAFNSNKGINEDEDFNDYAEDVFEGFLSTFTVDNGLIRIATENDEVGDEIEFLYTTKGARLAERMQDRLINLGCRYFPDGNIRVESHLYQEF